MYNSPQNCPHRSSQFYSSLPPIQHYPKVTPTSADLLCEDDVRLRHLVCHHPVGRRQCVRTATYRIFWHTSTGCKHPRFERDTRSGWRRNDYMHHKRALKLYKIPPSTYVITFISEEARSRVAARVYSRLHPC